MTGKTHYDNEYFKWQKSIGIFGGKANKIKFQNIIQKNQNVLDFGCGGGFLLDEFENIKKNGVEINEAARNEAIKKNIKVFNSSKDLPSDEFDVIVSDNALEHCDNPFLELKELYRSLKKGGEICIVVPLDGLRFSFKPNDKDFHLYSWSPMNLGNILTAAGFDVVESKPFVHKWFPFYDKFKRILPWSIFHVICRIYGSIDRRWFQVKAIATK